MAGLVFGFDCVGIYRVGFNEEINLFTIQAYAYFLSPCFIGALLWDRVVPFFGEEKVYMVTCGMGVFNGRGLFTVYRNRNPLKA